MEEKFNELLKKDTELAKEYLKKYYNITDWTKLIVIDSVEDFTCMLHHYCAPKDKKRENYVFRGLSKLEEKYCKLTRKYYLDNRNETIDDYIKRHFNDEILHIRKFEQKAGYLLQNYTMPIDLISTAQHYGLKTRFVDWTRSPLIATLFSLHGDLVSEENNSLKNGYYLLFATDMNKHIAIHNLTTGNTEEDRIDMYSNRYILYEKMILELIKVYKNREKDKEEVKKYFSKILTQTHTYCSLLKYCSDEVSKISMNNTMTTTCDKMVEKFIKNKILFLETNFTNERIVSQCGLFQIVIDISKKYMDKLLKDVEIIVISEEVRDDIQNYCKKIGINNYYLMPDLEMIASSVNNRFKDGQKK